MKIVLRRVYIIENVETGEQVAFTDKQHAASYIGIPKNKMFKNFGERKMLNGYRMYDEIENFVAHTEDF